MMNLLKVVLIGAGQMGKNHARVLAQLAREKQMLFVAIVDPNPAPEARSIAEQNGIIVYASWDELRNSDLRFDAVVIATPTALHYPLVMEALKIGCHVLVEKPIAATVKQAREMRDKATSMGCVLMVGQIEWFNPAVVEVIRILRSQKLGKVVSITTRRLGRHPGGRDAQVGIATDLAVHDLYNLLMIGQILGLTVSEMHVAGVNTALTSSPHEDEVTMMFPLEGAYFMVITSWLHPEKVREMEVVCTAGTILVDLIAKRIVIMRVNPEHNPDDPAQPLYAASVQKETYAAPGNDVEPLYAELKAFLQACAGGELAVDTTVSIRALSLAISASRQISEGG